MKRSEFERKMLAYWSEQRGLPRPDISADVYAAEAAGVVWDPEEELLPEKIQAFRDEKEWFLAPDESDWSTPERKAAAYREVVRRWNAWPELRAAVHRWLAGAEPPEQLGRAILAILDGKEGE